jgi:RNA polymerase sigma factor (sigma-70 family)
MQPSDPLACSCTWVRGDPNEEHSEEVLRRAFEAHYLPLLRLSTLLAGGSPNAEDIVQDVFVRSAGRLPGLSDPEVGPYLRTAVVNSWKNERRRLASDARKHRAAEIAARPASDAPSDDDLWEIIVQLPPRQRACLVLRYYEDLTEADVARLLGCSIGTVKSQTSRALDKVRKAVTR